MMISHKDVTDALMEANKDKQQLSEQLKQVENEKQRLEERLSEIFKIKQRLSEEVKQANDEKHKLEDSFSEVNNEYEHLQKIVSQARAVLETAKQKKQFKFKECSAQRPQINSDLIKENIIEINQSKLAQKMDLKHTTLGEKLKDYGLLADTQLNYIKACIPLLIFKFQFKHYS